MPDARYLPTSCGQRGHWVLQNNLAQFFPLFLLAQHNSKLKSPLLRTPHTLAVRLGENKIKPTRTLLAGCLAFSLPKGAIQIDSREKASRVLPRIKPYVLQRQPDGQEWGGHRPLGRAYCCHFVTWLCCQNTFQAFMSISVNVDSLDQRDFFLP